MYSFVQVYCLITFPYIYMYMYVYVLILIAFEANNESKWILSRLLYFIQLMSHFQLNCLTKIWSEFH